MLTFLLNVSTYHGDKSSHKIFKQTPKSAQLDLAFGHLVFLSPLETITLM